MSRSRQFVRLNQNRFNNREMVHLYYAEADGH